MKSSVTKHVSEINDFTRRDFCRGLTQWGAALVGGLAWQSQGQVREDESGGRAESRATQGIVKGGGGEEAFQLRYVLASALYGRMPLETLLREGPHLGISALDIWPEPHGNQREQIEAMGHTSVRKMLDISGMRVAMYTCYSPGLLKSGPWMQTVQALGGDLVVAHAGGKPNLTGSPLRDSISGFLDELTPLLKRSEELGVRIAVENHGGSMLHSAEAIEIFLQQIQDRTLGQVGWALAPYHLPPDPNLLKELIEMAGEWLLHVYAWERGEGSSTAQPKVMEMKQLPGYGSLDFTPLISGLKKIRYSGWTSIFMHPFPRGKPILPTAKEVTAAVNRSCEYLDHCVARS